MAITPTAAYGAAPGACYRWTRRPRRSAAGCCRHRCDRRISAPN